MKTRILLNALTVMCLLSTQILFAQNTKLEWAKRMGGSQDDQGTTIAVDSSGNVYSAGYFKGTANFSAGMANFISAGGSDIFVQKLDSEGNVLWVKQMGGSLDDNGTAIAVDAAGNVYLTGYFHGTVDFDPGFGETSLTSAGLTDIFIQKLDTDGNFVWVKQIGGTDNCYSRGITIDADGNIYTTGNFRGTANFHTGFGTSYLTSAGLYDIFIHKLNSEGEFVWAKRIGGSIDDVGFNIVVDPFGDISITGYFSGTVDFDPGDGTAFFTAMGQRDIYILKLNNDGDFLWAKSMGGNTQDVGYGHGVDTSGNVYVAGYFTGTASFGPGLGTANLTSFGSEDIFIQKFDSDGNFLWVKQIGGTQTDFARSIAIDATGNVYTVGYFRGTVDFDPGVGTVNRTSAGNTDIFILKLDTDGNYQWVECFGSSLIDFGWDIAVDAIGNVYTTGYFASTVNFNPWAGTTNLVSAGGSDVFVQKLKQCFSSGPIPTVAVLSDISASCEVKSSDIQAPTANDDCGGPITGTTNTTFPITTQGTTTITWIYDDEHGNITTQTQNVVITDITAPAPDVETLLDVTDECAVSSIVAPTATDNCAGVITGTTTTTFPITAQGTTSITWTYDDGNGNITTQTQDVVITDVIAPVPDVVTLSGVTDECAVSMLVAPTATDNCAGVITGTTATAFPITTQGTTTIIWTYDDGNGNTSTQTQDVVITDITAPVPDVETLLDVTDECEVSSITAPTATDNCAESITATTSTTFPITTQGTTTIIWTYDDGNGNIATQTQDVVITDVTAPAPDVETLLNVTDECAVTSVVAPTATDNCAGSITATTSTTFPITTQGTTTITWTYDDGNGNTSAQTQNVVIENVTDPVPNIADLPNLTAICEITALDATAPTATVNCAGVITGSSNQTFPITDQSITEIVWTYDDGNGNVTTQSQTINWTPVDVTTSLAGLTITSNNNNGTYQWVECDNNNAPISGENNQSFTASANGNYAVEITENGCVATSECVSIITVGLSEFEKNVKLTVYPNPSSDIFNIAFEKPIDHAVLSVTDIQGKLISTQQIHNASKTSIELNETPGVYLLTIKSKHGQKTIQLLKE